MIQRIQSLFIALVAIIHALLFIVPVYYWDTPEGHYVLKALYNIPLIVLHAVIILFSLYVIISFKDRKRQRTMVFILLFMIMGAISLFTVYMMQISASDGYILRPAKCIGIYLQLICLLFCFLAARRIKKDDDLVKSVDRVR